MANEMEQLEIVYAYSEGDWVGLYVNGQLKYQGHSVHPTDFAKALGLELQIQKVNEKWAYYHGTFPNKLEDVEIERL